MSRAARPSETTSLEFILNPFLFFFTEKSRRIRPGERLLGARPGTPYNQFPLDEQNPGRVRNRRAANAAFGFRLSAFAPLGVRRLMPPLDASFSQASARYPSRPPLSVMGGST
ncbi:MAG: hypothetical protein EPN70_10910 [Paraburkholderia sp.]|nr:MAG: hypothetical protein EPN70_10910 [Paraburkholderia sp.]TAM32380.1 MAG: hypothetical protein EPN59_00270 [Paraburkholderia sp.]